MDENSDRSAPDRSPGLRSESSPAVREALTVAIASGKGGTGKSFLATNLAVVAAQRGLRTTLVDCDFGMAADHLLLGIQPTRTLQDLVSGRAAPASCRMQTGLGPWFVAGRTGVQELANLGRPGMDRIAAALSEWSSDQDLLLLDAGAGITAQGIATIAAADHVLLVVQPEIASLTDAYAVVKCVARRPPPSPSLSVVVNRTVAVGQGRRAFRRLADVADRFLARPLHYLGEIVEEPAVSPRRLGQPPLVFSHPGCRIAAEIGAVLDRLSAVVGGIRPSARARDASIADRLGRNLLGLP